MLKEKGGILNPIDLAESMLDFADLPKSGTYTFNGGKRSDSDIESFGPEMGTYTFNGGKRSDKDIDSVLSNSGGWDPRSPKGTDTYNGGRPSDKD